MIERKKKRTAKIATFAVAHEVYFKQFEGLYENLLKYHEDFILVGHDGPHHLAIAEGRPILRSLKKYHGKPGSGASVEFKIKEGPTHHYALGIGHHAETIKLIADILGIESVIVR